MAQRTFLDSTELVLNMGPQHPSTHGVLRVILKLDGEKVIGTECVIGYLHRGVEKIAENRTYQHVRALRGPHGLRAPRSPTAWATAWRWKSCWASRRRRARKSCASSSPS